MKIISQEELLKFELKVNPRSLKKTNLLRDELDKIEVGQILFIGSTEWDIKSSPSCMINSWYVKNKTGKVFSQRTLVDDSGWIITRLK